MSTTPTDPLPPSAAEFDVFISHATPDDAIVTRIAERLTAVGIRSWVDHERGISYGDNWDRAIHAAANTCRYGLFVLSPRSAKSEYCIAEWNRILALGKRLYIALIDPVPLTDIPLRLGTLQYADLTRDFDGALNALIAAIQAERGLDPSLATTGQALRLAGYGNAEPFLPKYHCEEADHTRTQNVFQSASGSCRSRFQRGWFELAMPQCRQVLPNPRP